MCATIQFALLCDLAGVVASQSLQYSADFTVAGDGCYCWTSWLDRDNPSGTGDHETLAHMPRDKVCSKPVGIQYQTTSKLYHIKRLVGQKQQKAYLVVRDV